MFKKAVLILSNGKKIKIKTKYIKIKDLDIEFQLPLKYYGYFSTQETSLAEGYFKTLFSKSQSFNFDLDSIPVYEIDSGKLIVKSKLEEF